MSFPKPGTGGHACNPSYSGGRDQKDQSLKPAQGKQFVRPYLKKTHHRNRAGGRAGECLPRKHEAQSSNASNTKKKKNVCLFLYIHTEAKFSPFHLKEALPGFSIACENCCHQRLWD
jgi:hypothetical protein